MTRIVNAKEKLREELISFANGLHNEKDVQEGIENMILFFKAHPYLVFTDRRYQWTLCDAFSCTFRDSDGICSTQANLDSGALCISHTLDYNGED